MPLYEYECEACGHKQDEIHGFDGPSEKILCEKCSSDKMNKCVSAAYSKFNFPCQTNTHRGVQTQRNYNKRNRKK